MALISVNLQIEAEDQAVLTALADLLKGLAPKTEETGQAADAVSSQTIGFRADEEDE